MRNEEWECFDLMKIRTENGRRAVEERGAGGALPSRALPPLRVRPPLPFQIDEFLQHFIAGGDRAGVGLERTLSNDHIHEFLAEVHVGLLDRA